MKPFTSITEFINYYNQQQTIPSNIAKTINGTTHEFTKTSHHNTETITKSMVDNYTFKENDADGLGIELNINYYRYFDAKAIVEAYMLFFIDETLYLHPIYFHNGFVTEPDFQPYIYAVSNSLEKWTSLKWINTDSAPNAFVETRANAYRDIQKDLFYQQTTLYEKDNDHSVYFDTSIEVPECW